MAEMANVTATETITSEWGNDIRDRTVQRYADISERASEISSPSPGDLSYLEDSGDVDIYHFGAWRHIGDPVGTLKMNAGVATPIGWLVCNGSAVSRTTYAALFAAIDIAWGDGDGSTTFNLPDFRGRVPRGVAATGTGDALGDVFGADTHTHTGPSHAHSVNPPNTNTGLASGTVGDGHTPGSVQHTHAVDISPFNTVAGGTQNTGSVSTIQAGAAVHFLIKT